MSLTARQVMQRASALFAARRDATPITAFGDTGRWTLADAYRVQRAVIDRHLGAGERIAGVKVGMNTRWWKGGRKPGPPGYGWLTDAMLADEGEISLRGLIRPQVQPEVGFLLGEDLSGRNVDFLDVLAAADGIVGCLEVTDSRFARTALDATENVADNLCAARCITGGRLLAPDAVDLERVGVVVSCGGGTEITGSGAETFGGPARAVASVVRALARDGSGLVAGHLVISGGLTSATMLRPGMQLTAEFGALGPVSLRARSAL